MKVKYYVRLLTANVCQNLMTPYRGGWCLSSTLLVHELRTYLYGANILELTLTCYVRDLAKPYITSENQKIVTFLDSL